MNNQLFQLLGLAMRARKVSIGEQAFDAIANHSASLVLYAKDAGDNTKKKVIDKCSFYHIDMIEVDSQQELSSAIGKANIVMLAIIDEGFAKSIKKI